MAYKNKTYVAFDGDKDIRYYYLMKAWKHNDNTSFNFFDAHDMNNIYDSSKEQTIKNSLQERMRNANSFILLVGESTRYLYKFVRWEIEQAIKRDLPIIIVNLNGMKQMDENRCPPILSEALCMNVSFNQKIIEFSLDNWLTQHYSLRKENKGGAYYYNTNIYNNLGL